MRTQTARNVILGAGAMGAATAYHLARRGEDVCLVEQYELGHNRGSSHGSARIIRHSYADPVYARLMLDAYKAWRALEADAGQVVYLRTGGVSISPAGGDYVAQVAASLEAIGVPHRRMSGEVWNQISPTFGLKPDDDVVFEPDAGLLRAATAIALQVELAQKIGGERTQVIERSPVRKLDLEGEHPTLIFDDHILIADRLIVTAGAWTGQLIPTLAALLQPTRQQVLYFRPVDPDRFAVGRFPVFIFKGAGELDAYYGMPEALGMGVKVARHGGSVTDPDILNQTIEADYLEEIQRFLQRTIPGLAGVRIERTEVCLYTMSEGERFLLGPLPGHPRVVVASPCSGHGFKFSCLIGRVLADLAIDRRTEIDTKSWLIR